MKRIIGLMGNSGSGKSMVAAYLKEKGAQVIDADEVSRRLCMPGQRGLAAVKKAFAPHYFHDDGTLDRRALGRLVFANKAQRKKLEDILHPMIVEEIRNDLASATSDIVVIDAALLHEVGADVLATEVWLVMADMNQKISRIMQRDGISVEDAVNRLKSQQDEAVLAKHADKIIKNEGDPQLLYRQVEEYLYGARKG